MDPHVNEWVNLVVRWIHVITGIAWIGSSFFFNWLDMHLTPPEVAKKGVGGELWMVHGGGFYQVEKYMVAPEKMPSMLHWFKWESYFTWISGFALLVIVYYFGASAYLIDPAVSDIGPGAAIVVGLVSLVGGWFVYDLLCLSPLGQHPRAFAATGFVLVTIAAYGLTHVFSGRGAYLHVGAMLGTLMAWNVWRRIIPAQRALVDATNKGVAVDASLGKKAKQRSLHNNYMTLPVLFVMISHHFPSTFGHPSNWAILAGLTLVGSGTRHFFNLRNKGKLNMWLLPTAAVSMIALAIVTSPRYAQPTSNPEHASTGDHVKFADVRMIIATRCQPCHSVAPTDNLFTIAPNGVVMDTPDQIARLVDRINFRAVVSSTMPLANKTNMTPKERGVLARWIGQGAKLE